MSWWHPMKREVRDMWTAELRSGRREQGKNYLRQGDKFCNLGVLVDLYVREPGVKPLQITHVKDGTYVYDGTTMFLPEKVAVWAQIDETDNDTRSIIGSLMEDNDNGVPFAELADKIEEEL